MNILLTGANGFIGRHLTAYFLSRGHQVRAAVRQPEKLLRRVPEAQAVTADLNQMTHAADWAALLEDVDAVVNCAGALDGRNGQDLENIHHLAPLALAEACATAKVRKFVQISIVSIDGDTLFAQSKKRGDDALMATGLDWVILRPSLVYGRGAFGGSAALRALAACPWRLPLIGDGQQIFQPIHVQDLCKTVEMAVTGDRLSQTIIAPCGPDSITLRELLANYRAWLGLPAAKFIRLPKILVGAMAWLGDRFGAGAICSTALKQLRHGNLADPEAFTTATAISPRPMRQAMLEEPAGTAELWHARMMLLRGPIAASLVLLWIASGLIGLFSPYDALQRYGAALGLSDGVGWFAFRSASILSLWIAALLLWRTRPMLVVGLQLLVIAGYSAIVTTITPELWFDPFGPLIKNIPIAVLVLINGWLQIER